MARGPVSAYHSLPMGEDPSEVPTEVPQKPFGFSPPRTPRTGSSRLQGGIAEVLIACAAIALPMICLSLALLGLIFANQVPPAHSLFQDDQARAALPLLTDPGNAYLVNFSATQLITIASWASSVAPHLPTYLMTLCSYPLARKLLRSSHQDAVDKLPTPYQLTILLELRNGSLKSLWNYFRYSSRKAGNKPIAALSNLAKIFMLATLCGWLILAADTWLHVTTSTVPYVGVTAYFPPLWSFGRGLPAGCYLDGATCSMMDTGVVWLLGGTPEPFRTLYNISDVTRISTFELEGQSYAYVADAMSVSDVNDDWGAQWDFLASTFAISTTCTPITSRCNPTTNSSSCVNFQCSEAFSGSLGCDSTVFASPTVNAFGLRLFFDEGLTQEILLSDFFAQGFRQNYSFNPFHIGMYATVSTNGGEGPLNGSAEVAHGVAGGDSWILSCSATVWDAEYSSVNQTITWADVTKSNATTAAAFAWPFWANYGFDVLERASVLADFAATMQDVANQTALAFSTTALALTSGTLEQRPNLLEQGRGGAILVARIPKAPLFTLVALNLLFAVLGVAFAVMAAFARPSRTRDVQARLGIAGIVAEKFEDEDLDKMEGVRSVKDLFAENRGGENGPTPRIGIVRTQAGAWKYRLWRA
ncbi:uncharacterized protein Z520_10090 [Fonsecaea multimorphosa CBS 102226]|uniref:Uncharacterized protein n=1 Tax=Fonsecaea multimorphosa CBS 102226 TaxID=1442371 RepID=A0A0D2JU88_9EURO|nr:uncharacterized protein Z520_10090 [Fonsecaea multimorphosa CBS 102226]KIX94064.1 hypothetical protein Z520_10090 [Fonsecaea multimorphosa CBS 102226]OAL19418.1 hypothetical protein AYO22_09580 [Fonsecaea multimorphosa]